MQDNINEIITKSLAVNKDNLYDNINNIILGIKEAININKDSFDAASRIDQKHDNGFQIDFSIVNNIFSNIEKESIMYGSVTLSQKDDENKIIYSRQIFDYGNVSVITEGNFYIILEIILKNILAGNNTIIFSNGYMFGTNNLLVQIIQTILQKYEIGENLIQLCISKDYDKILSNYANIDLVVCIGSHSLQRIVLEKSKNKTIVSGYESFDIYVEDESHLDFVKKILNTGLNIQLYLKDNINLDYDNTIVVEDIEEAIAQINYNGSRYSTAIFTSDKENASRFIREVKSSIVTVNTSPSIERIIDIKEEDLVKEKTIIYPLNFTFDNNNLNINLNE